jgi:hypothetical protein
VIESSTRIWIAAGFTDLRRGFQGLSSIVKTVPEQAPFSGHVFVFRGKFGDPRTRRSDAYSIRRPCRLQGGLSEPLLTGPICATIPPMHLANIIIAENEDLKIRITIDFEAAKYSLAPQEADVLMEDVSMSLMRALETAPGINVTISKMEVR